MTVSPRAIEIAIWISFGAVVGVGLLGVWALVVLLGASLRETLDPLSFVTISTLGAVGMVALTAFVSLLWIDSKP